jgi:hypothetical protein
MHGYQIGTKCPILHDSATGKQMHGPFGCGAALPAGCSTRTSCRLAPYLRPSAPISRPRCAAQECMCCWRHFFVCTIHDLFGKNLIRHVRWAQILDVFCEHSFVA